MRRSGLVALRSVVHLNSLHRNAKRAAIGLRRLIWEKISVDLKIVSYKNAESRLDSIESGRGRLVAPDHM